MDWIVEHWEQLAAIASAAMVLGGLIVKLTPTKTDDKWFRKLKGLLPKGKGPSKGDSKSAE